MLFLTFAVNITQVGFESFFPRKLSATNRAFLFDSCRLFLHGVNSHPYLYILYIYPPSKRREPVGKDRVILRASLATAMGQASGFSLLKIQVIMPVIGNKENSIWRSSLNVLFIG